MVVAADAALAGELVTDEQRPAYEAYLEEVRKASEIDRLSTDRPKTGVFLGVHATNPVTGEQIPVWAADYVLADYGTGAIMAVPGQDQRDWDFATKFDLPIVRTVQPPEGWEGEAYVGAGSGRELRPRRHLAGRHGGRRGEAHDHRVAGGEGGRRGHGQLPAARLAAEPAALLGRADPDRPLPRRRRGRRCRTTSCRWSCRS